MTQAGIVTALYRYPVKGLSPDPLLGEVTLETGATMPLDRAYAIENGATPFDPANPQRIKSSYFVTLTRSDQLALFTSSFDEASHTLTLSRNGEVVARGDLRTPEGRAAIEAVLAENVRAGVRGAPRIISGTGINFTDTEKTVHVINLASLRALEAEAQMPLDLRRFRPNIVVDGLPAWSELGLLGKSITAGDVVLKVIERTARCAATNVNPQTAERDSTVPSYLKCFFGHVDFGVYATISEGGALKPGDPVVFNA